ncbi:MAG: hypothetical protein E7255_16310 [Lachnospiraceae bacterium]|nr:hypothetical protein [Lachnospiraceae bacterium]
MIRWTSRLYIGEKLKKKKKRAIRSITKQKVTYGIYCITFASHPDNLFDIMDANELMFPHYQRADICIVGLANGRDEAVGLVRDMLMEVYRETGDFKVRSYFT